MAATARRLEELAALGRALAASDRRSAATASTAAAHYQQAISNAEQARQRLARALELSAQVHDRVAALHEGLSVAGSGDRDEHQRKVREHRAAAEHDRRLASEHLDMRGGVRESAPSDT